MNRLTNAEWNDLKAVAHRHNIVLSDIVREAFGTKEYHILLDFFCMADRYIKKVRI